MDQGIQGIPAASKKGSPKRAGVPVVADTGMAGAVIHWKYNINAADALSPVPGLAFLDPDSLSLIAAEKKYRRRMGEYCHGRKVTRCAV
jgi:hypothetical protein